MYTSPDLSNNTQSMNNLKSNFIVPGISVVELTQIEIKRAASTGSPKFIFHVINPEGKEGRVHSRYLSNPDMEKEGLIKISELAHASGRLDKLNITAEKIEDYVKQASEILKGSKIRMKICGQEYLRNNGGVGIMLSLPRFEAFEPVNDLKTKLKFNKDNRWDYMRLAIPDTEEKEQSIDEVAIQGDTESEVL